MLSVRSPRLVGAAALVALSCVGAVACSSADDQSVSSDTTTGTVDRLAPTTTQAGVPTTRAPGSEQSLAGLWFASPVGITNEKGDKFATPQDNQILRNPVDDQAGGVFYLRCTGGQPTCAIEHVVKPEGTPVAVGLASQLIALGTVEKRPVLIAVRVDSTRVPSQATGVSDHVVDILDVQSNVLVGTYPWFGSASSPFATDIEGGQIVVCFGAGEMCQITMMASPMMGASAPLTGVGMASVRSLALDDQGKMLTWVEIAPTSGSVTAYQRDLVTGDDVYTTLRQPDDPGSNEAVTDGIWTAVRVGRQVFLHELRGAKAEGERDAPDGVTQIAIRSDSGGGGAASDL